MHFDNILQKLNKKRYSIKIKYIVGDFNQDLIKYDNDVGCQNLIDNAHNNGFVQLISRPTRITEHSATLLNLTFTDNIDSTLSCNILTLDLSDHLATHTKISLGSTTRESRTFNSNREENDYRIFNEANNQIFEQLISEETWDEVNENIGAQESYEKFDEIYLKHYNTAYPIKTNRIRRKNERKNPSLGFCRG